MQGSLSRLQGARARLELAYAQPLVHCYQSPVAFCVGQPRRMVNTWGTESFGEEDMFHANMGSSRGTQFTARVQVGSRKRRATGSGVKGKATRTQLNQLAHELESDADTELESLSGEEEGQQSPGVDGEAELQDTLVEVD